MNLRYAEALTFTTLSVPLTKFDLYEENPFGPVVEFVSDSFLLDDMSPRGI
jgi:hypothetical protein